MEVRVCLLNHEKFSLIFLLPFHIMANQCSECNTALSKVRYLDDIYTEHKMNPVCRAAVAQWNSQWIYASSNLERRIFLILHQFIVFDKFKNI